MIFPCPSLICVIPPDLNYSTQGFPPEPLPPVNPPCNFKNEAAYFNDVCSVGSPSFSGSLPNWLTIDAANNRLVCAANTFCGATLALANENAQKALNQFVVTNLENGNLTCATPCFSTTGDNGFFLFSDLASNRLVCCGGTSNPLFLNASSRAPISTYGSAILQNRGCYAPSAKKFYLYAEDQTHILSFDLDGNLVSTIPIPAGYLIPSLAPQLVYDSVSDRVFCLLQGSDPALIFRINPNTDAYDSVSTGMNSNTLSGATYQSPGVVWIQGDTFPDSTLYGFETSGLTAYGTVALVRTGDSLDDFSTTGVFPSFVNGSNGKLYIAAIRPVGDFVHYESSIFEIDPIAKTVDHIFNLTADAGFSSTDKEAAAGLCFNGGFIYACDYYGHFCKIDISSRAYSRVITFSNDNANNETIGIFNGQIYIPNSTGGFCLYPV